MDNLYGALKSTGILNTGMNELGQSLNNSELLSKIMKKHSATKSVRWGIIAGVTGAAAIYGCCLLFGPASIVGGWWLNAFVTSHWSASCAVTGATGIASGMSAKQAYDQSKHDRPFRKKCIEGEVVFSTNQEGHLVIVDAVQPGYESFNKSLRKVLRILALLFAKSMDYDITFNDNVALKKAFLENFGLDLEDVGTELYDRTHLEQAREMCERAYHEFTGTLDLLHVMEG